MERLLEPLGPIVQFVYMCSDRIVLHDYRERLQRPENLIYFFHDVLGVACIDQAVLEQRIKTNKAWVRGVTDDVGIPVMAQPLRLAGSCACHGQCATWGHTGRTEVECGLRTGRDG